MDNRIAQQINFILEIDKLKNILRQNKIADNSRPENTAEHSWHIAMMAIILAEYALPETDLLRAIQMLLIHDIVEIDAGDVFCYDTLALQGKSERERQAASRLFGLLPDDQGKFLLQLWLEFEETATPTAKYAAALDRLQPLFLNQKTYGGTWVKHDIKRSQVMQRVAAVQEGIPPLWSVVREIIETCVEAGYLKAV
ncbi:MAG: HD domain-containing protein [Jaaginema sp. PMC 1079.18]|nr:HD domain-containing protein [Jaaginema sp. PMC 1080.18]MEC4849527.1 HD domain-containing protein [Jaaginema sp. PMC 1079.18]MEC4865719.1 HD domain-containing protein [Jaaginema sp. PMC 1078.18]